MQAPGRSPLDCSAPLVARARAAATPLFWRVGPFDYMQKKWPLPRCRRRAPLPARFEAAALSLPCVAARYRHAAYKNPSFLCCAKEGGKKIPFRNL